MHATLAELLEDLKSGLLWVNRDGVVRYANGDASTRTGLVPVPRPSASGYKTQGVRILSNDTKYLKA